MLKRIEMPVFVLCVCLAHTSCLELRNKNGKYLLKNVGAALDLKILTFNILSTADLGSVSLGYPLWNERKDAVFGVVEELQPDLVSVQECSPSQLDQFESRFAGNYVMIDNRAFTSDALLLFKRGRFELIERGHWALENPISLQIRRLAVWAKLRDRDSKRELMIVATHVDAKDIRNNEVKLLREKMSEQEASGAPIFLAGDFNMDSSHEDYPIVASGGWQDSYMGPRNPETPTFTWKEPTRRIDHVFFFGAQVHGASWQAITRQDVILSDHRPVIVQVKIDASP